MSWSVRPGSQEEQVGRLILAGVLVMFLPQLPLGNYIIYPFTILTTWFHEMGHGLTAMLLGYDFELLKIFPDGSGFAQSYSIGPKSAIASALVSAGGPLGPSMIGSILILASSRKKYWRPALAGLAAAITLSTIIWVRSITGIIVLPLIAAAVIAISLRGADWLVRFALQFLGILAAMSMFRDWDYLFSQSANIGGQVILSDTGAIAEVLLLPYWFWAIVIIIISGVMIGASLKYALAEDDSLGGWQPGRR
ncbi:M50 family metallopeptidase [Pontixanthobacter sp.]|uniref:M50 family metallopeptidase n=1 Tax=Pontixanthobacter sp. TaxID=2792078 RepID=UPI003C7AD0C8